MIALSFYIYVRETSEGVEVSTSFHRYTLPSLDSYAHSLRHSIEID